MRRSAGPWVALGVLAALGLAVLVLTPREARPPFDASSSAPDGYRALAILLGDAGVEVDSASPGDPEAVATGVGRGVVVPVAEYLDQQDRRALEEAAGRGATVVLAGVDGYVPLSDTELTRAGARPVPRGFCDIAELVDLEALDAIEGASLPGGPGERVCFDSGFGPQVTSRSEGTGRVLELSSPYLWSNARLQPDKEDGGRALDNGPMGVALLGDLEGVTFVQAEPPPTFEADGSRNPLELLPLPVKLALAQAVGAFLVYLLWKGRRLGDPVTEDLPVEIAGSELVEAVGGLLQRRGSPAGAARVLRAQSWRNLGEPLGLPPGAGPDGLVPAVAARTGRDPDELRRLLFDTEVATADDLVALSRSLDELELEVLDVRPIG